MSYGRPGVYISERLLPAQISANGTANAAGAVLGQFAQGPITTTLVTSWYDFVNKFGGYNTLYPATYGVGLFFQNGGSELYVQRVLHTTDSTSANNAKAASVSIPSNEAALTATITTANVSGTTVTYTATNTFTAGQSVTITGLVSSGNPSGTAGAGYNLVGATIATASGTQFTVTITAGAVTGTYTSGGTATVGVVHTLGTVSAKDLGADGNNFRVQFAASPTATQNGLNYFDLTVYKEGGTSSSSMDITNDVIVEQFNSVTFNDAASTDYVATVVNLQSRYITMAVTSNVYAPATAVLPLTGGQNGNSAVVADYTAASNFTGLTALNRPLVVFAPGIIDTLGSTDGATVQNSLVGWAAANNSFAVLDTPGGLEVVAAQTYSAGLTKSSNAAVYYPNIYITDPTGRSSAALRKVGPAGAIAGLFIQTDKQTGPFKAPAGVYASVRGAVALEKTLSSTELDTLNTGSAPLNAIRNLPGAGIVSMGARTLLQDGTANKYVNMRRSLNYVRKNLDNIAQFALFENNDEVLWGRLRTALGAFLNDYRNQGGLRGATADEAYYVKCDAENNPDSSIANGEVHIEVGVALQYPAEFVVINLSQKTAA